MRKRNLFALCSVCFTLCVGVAASAAEPVQRRGNFATTSVMPLPASNVATRGAVGMNIVQPSVVGRAAATGTTNQATTAVSRSAVAPRSATSATTAVATRTITPQSPVLSARAASMQKVIQSGTGIIAPNENVVVDEACRARFVGCMDSFCMLENDNGGRCLCSDRKAELDQALANIELLDEQSYKLATEGVERIEMGAKADYVFTVAEMAERDAMMQKAAEERRRERQQLNLGIFEMVGIDTDLNVFQEEDQYDLGNKTGESLRNAVYDICRAQMAGCEAHMPMLQLIYTQNVASDCRAYENELKKREDASKQKLAAAQRAVRDAALESFETANKWDLGQCTIQMINCVKNNGCGDDFTGCVSIVASDMAAGRGVRRTPIRGTSFNIDVAASTLEALESKRTICFDTVTASCIAAKPHVWDAFLREVAPAVKSAELAAEANIRMNCISDLSNCFQKACMDTFDPNNPDGSYDACLSRPQIYTSVCKIQVDACTKTEPAIMEFVEMRLKQMRGDACTVQARQCFLGDNACGNNFEQCIGLGLNQVKQMCPISKLTACNVDENGQLVDSITDLDQFIYGIYLAMDNSALEQCQRIADEKMIEVCGDTGWCEAFEEDKDIGTESLTYQKNSDGDHVIEGLVSFSAINITNNALNIDGYLGTIGGGSRINDRIRLSLQSVQGKIENKVAMLENDTRVRFCVEGRDTRQIFGRATADNARFPNLTDSFKKMIIEAGIRQATKNFNKKYNELYAKALEGQSAEIANAACMAFVSDMSSAVCDGVDPNTGMCNKYSMGPINAFDGKTSKTDTFATSITIPGAKISDLMKMNSSGLRSYVLADPISNAALATVDMVAIFSLSTRTCTITSTFTGCKNATIVYNETSSDLSEYSSKCGGLAGCGFVLAGGKNNQTRMNVQETSTFAGAPCTEFEAPIKTTDDIKM